MNSEQFLGEKRIETNIPNSWPWKRPKKKTYFDSADSAHLATPRGFTSKSHDHDHDTFVFFGTGILGNTGLRLVVRIRSLEQLEENARQAGGIYANGIGNDDAAASGRPTADVIYGALSLQHVSAVSGIRTLAVGQEQR